MAQLCRETPLPIALDEELIGVNAVSYTHLVYGALQMTHPEGIPAPFTTKASSEMCIRDRYKVLVHPRSC